MQEDTLIGKGIFGVAFIGMYLGNEVPVKKMKEVGGGEESVDEFAKEAFLHKFRCDQSVHFYGSASSRTTS